MSDRAAGDGAWQPWHMDPLDRRAPARREGVPGRRQEDYEHARLIDNERSAAREQGYQEGHAEGLAKGHAEGEAAARAEHAQQMADALAERAAMLDDLIESFGNARTRLAESMATRLTDFGLEVGRQLAGEAIRLAPAAIVGEVQALLAEHPDLDANPTLYLNVDDLAVVKERLATAVTAAGWRLRGDINLRRGDCRIETEALVIDDSFEGRWQRLREAVGHAAPPHE